MEDSILISRVIGDNDHKAFAELMDKYQRMVFSTCRGFVSSQHEVEDIAQDVFIELYESLPSFRKESKLSTWIYRITVNKSLNYLRKKKRELTLFSFLLGGGNGDSELQVVASINSEADYGIVANEEKRMLKSAINKLPESQRVALILSKYQDLPYKEIAEVMDVSVSSVESLLFRAKTNLRKYLADFQKK